VERSKPGWKRSNPQIMRALRASLAFPHLLPSVSIQFYLKTMRGKLKQDHLECDVLLKSPLGFDRAINTPDSKKLELKEARGASSSVTPQAILDKRGASAFSKDAQAILLRRV
jgi:hypothetical protein